MLNFITILFEEVNIDKNSQIKNKFTNQNEIL